LSTVEQNSFTKFEFMFYTTKPVKTSYSWTKIWTVLKQGVCILKWTHTYSVHYQTWSQWRCFENNYWSLTEL